MPPADLRKLKDQATKAIEKKQYARAAELYLQIAAAEPNEPDWPQRAGEALRKVPDGPAAAAQLTIAAEGYARGGFLLKAIAVCKVVLQIEPGHTATQAMLAELYARREAPLAPPSLPLTRPARPSVPLAALPRAPAPPPNPPPPPRGPNPPSPRPAARAHAQPGVALLPDQPIGVDEVPRRPAPPARPLTIDDLDPPLGLRGDTGGLVALDDRPRPALPPTAPLEILPLHAVLGGRKSSQFMIDELMPPESQPAAYEISLDEELALADAIPVELPPPAPAPVAPASADELDFSTVMDDAPPPAPIPPPPASAPPLPRIPLLSSLGPDELRHVIERVEVRDAAAGDLLMRQGDAGGSLFVIVAGEVEVRLEQRGGPPPRVLATLGDGAFFGELGLLTNFPRSATVMATQPTQLLEISRELVSEIVARSPEVLKTLLRFFRDRLLDRLLGESPLFAPLPPDDARALAGRFMFLELEPGMRAVVEGERAPGLFLLLCGEARVERAGTKLAALSPGDVFGEMSLLERKPASATIVTATKCWALELPRADFQEIMLTYPQLLEYVAGLAERRKQANDGKDDRVEFL
jgi:CRP-like cAMP-binding protein